ncbi:MAG TPA: histidine kinase [Solirubrobacteraceae bacterium]|nr:histidine kinase [Solirubrobacteraceae bacterium]
MPSPATRLLARIRALRGWRADAALAGLVVVEGLLELALLTGPADQRLLGIPFVAGLAVAVGLRRRWPIAAVALGILFVTVFERVPAFENGLVGPFLCVGLLTYSLGRYVGERRLPLALVVGFGGTAIAMATDPSADGSLISNVLWGGVVVVGLPFLGGRAARNRSRLNAALRAKRLALEHERVHEAERAVLEERGRIAGELHDVVSHALSAMTVQASAARRLAGRDPAAARGAFAAVEETGREALGELRRLLGVLRRADEDLALAPQPSLAHLETLARRSLAAGLPVELTVRGDAPPALSVGLDLTAYRVVQAALRAARDEGHAGRARVSVSYAPDAVSVIVADDGRASSVRSLLGMRERVTVYGGELAAEPGPGGGHVLRARFPVGSAA